ncbi:hypothetical protein ACFWFF_05100 [Streptomyces sp. NPDC060223]
MRHETGSTTSDAVSHLSFLENPSAVNNAIREFIATQEEAAVNPGD